MKLTRYIAAVAALIVTASCSKPDPLPPADDQQPEVEQPEDQIPEVPSDGLVDKIITVSNLQSKTFVDGSFTDDGKVMMKWFADDSISVWDGVANRKFVMVSEPVGTYAVFKGRVSPEATDFYAFYPYKSDLQISQGNGCRFTAPLLQSQYANPEGGVVSDAVYAAGKVDAQERLSFSIKPSFLIFSFDEDESVASVSIEGNSDDDYLYGSWQLDCSPEGTVTSSFADDSMRGKKVTFANEDGTPLRTGVTYYMVLPEVNFEAGYTVTILNSDGTETVKKTVRNFDFIGQNTYVIEDDFAPEEVPTYYDIYSSGEDITIAGVTYNKSEYGDPTLIESGSEYTITTTKGAFFIEPGANVTYNPSSSVTKMLIIGSDPSERSVMTQKTHYKVATDGVIAVMNLDINADALTGSTYLFNIYSTNTPKRFALDNCAITFGNKNFMYHAKTTWVSEVAFHNCDIKFTYSSSSDLWLFTADSQAPSVELMDFQNNVFWHAGTMASGKAFRITNGSSIALNKLVFKNNTFVNLPTRTNQTSYISANIAAAEVVGNIFYFDAQPVNGALLQQGCPEVTSSDNFFYTGGGDVTFHGCTVANHNVAFTATEGSPFSSMDLATGKFVKTSNYANFGAIR